MNRPGDLVSQPPLGRPFFRRLGCLLLERLDLLLWQERENLQEPDDIRVLDPDEKLVEVVVGRPAMVEIDGVAFALAEFLAVAVADQRERQAERLPPRRRRINSTPAVIFPHWSEPPICTRHPSASQR